MASKTLPKLPVIDLSLTEDLRAGTRTWESMCKEDLFNLPSEIKQQKPAHRGDWPIGRAYSYGLKHERIDTENLTTLEGAQSFTKLMWPSGNDQFCKSSHEMSKIMMNLDQTVVRMVFQNYGDGVNGLEIQTRDEQWILYDPPSHSSFIYLASDAFKNMAARKLSTPLKLTVVSKKPIIH
ncbi:hypothetical protein Pint_29990 [Pistacia integerrima]|uniref:Uncharacterized protein n=1 Tax=Pistacia integerrima TaxID=434235 RepID=A0ACC0X585_9ROSI|nr:hypothetical protein Pint_29990 [Pistacia integerrima]